MGYLTTLLDEMVKHTAYQKKIFTQIWKESPPGSLQVRKRSGKREYIHALPRESSINPGDLQGGLPDQAHGPTSRYIRKSLNRSVKTIHDLADKEYARVALNRIRENEKRLSSLVGVIRDITPETLLREMRSAYQTLPQDFFSELRVPAEHRDRQRQWAEGIYVKSNHRPENLNKMTSRGLPMRSKSEVLIAEKLYEYDIPFRYEQVIPIGRYEMAPDFTFLDRYNEEFYLEYCGVMDDPDYVEHQLWREKQYRSLGIVPWKNIIYLYDSNNHVDMGEVVWILQKKILPRL